MEASLHFGGVESPATREVQDSRTCRCRPPQLRRRDRSTLLSKMHAEAAGEKAVSCGVSNASKIEELSFIKQRHLRLAHSANKQENSFKTFPVALSQGENLKFLTFVGGKGKSTYFLIEGFNGAAPVAVPFMYVPYSGPRHVSPLQVSTIFKSPRGLLHPKLVASEARYITQHNTMCDVYIHLLHSPVVERADDHRFCWIQLIRSGPDEYQ
ncbi:aspartokinase 1 [Pyrus ussuriensis x Pyrus communis]|uniref:Aspartokinase 1 n=1 Tax=Pyrus ussuriensis x Pyrus communis TaxID=2448454 RepID=A0A5N5F816_9ROSA|nr:aspartokinase 1 [Pyrus ussuriensis x Pyrus communis]